jgi:proline iminopeptidase
MRKLVACSLACLVVGAPCAGDETAAPAVPDTGTVAAGPFRLRYHIEGMGRSTLVIGSADYYRRAFSRDLRRHLRLAFLDHRGFAPPPAQVDASELSLGKVLDDVERARRQLGLGRVVAVGHSGHALMALEYAKKYPDSVTHVVMIGMAPDLSAASGQAAERYWNESVSPERKAVLQENRRRLPDEELARFAPGERMVRAYLRNGPRTWFDPRFDATPLFEGVAFNADVFSHLWGETFRDIDVTRGLAALDRPVLLALGRYDFIVAPPSSWDRVRPHFRDLTVRVFERSGHTPQYEEAETFDAELRRWLEGGR